MRLASTSIQLIDKISKLIDNRIERAVNEEKDKKYINTLSELQSFVSQIREFMTMLKSLENIYTDLSHGRICFRWIYSESGSNISLVKLEPRFSISYSYDRLSLSFDDRSITLYEGSKMRFIVNTYDFDIDLDNEEDVIIKRSLILDVISKISIFLERSINNINLCIKYARQR